MKSRPVARQHLCILFEKKGMENKDSRFPEQQAPDKNTDNAFVQVGKDGHPVIPGKDTASTHGQNPSQQVPKEDGPGHPATNRQ